MRTVLQPWQILVAATPAIHRLGAIRAILECVGLPARPPPVSPPDPDPEAPDLFEAC